MKIADLLNLDRIEPGSQAASKKRALEELSAMLARSVPELSQEQIFESLLGRERLGSTGLGHGVALPHGRVQGRDQAIGAFLRLEQGVDFDAIDNQPVDMLFALLVPEQFTDEHLNILAQLAEMFANSGLCDEIRKSRSGEQVLDLISHWTPEHSSRTA